MSEKFDIWVELLFGPCKEVDLSTKSSRWITLELEALASRCIWVTPFGESGLAPVTFTAANTDLTLLRDTTIGRAGTTLESRASPLGSSTVDQGMHFATWRDFVQDGGKKNLYVVSNLATRPSETQARTLDLVVSRGGHTLSSWQSSPMASEMAPPPIKPSHEKHVPKLSKQLADSQAMITAQAALDRQSLTPNMSAGNTMTRKPRQKECRDGFKYSACGPTTNVGLGLLPGTASAFSQTSGQGGVAGQAMAGLQAMASANIPGDGGQIPNYLKAKSAIDGSEVSIEFPIIEYGFTGTIERAAITVIMKISPSPPSRS